MKPVNEIDILKESIVLMENKLAVKLMKANRELDSKNVEIEKSAAELILANKELTFQYKERGSLTAELIIANKELAYQYGEREKREAELVIANKELVFQNEENKKNAVELIIAKREIAFNKLEKDIRASELIIANKKLIFKTQERQIKTAELNIANRELKKAEEKQKEYIKGLEKMIFMTSHKVRQPIANILGFSNMLDESISSPEELKLSVDSIKQSALTLDTFTRELTTFMCELGKVKK
jgi:signal transduction histidine kinase